MALPGDWPAERPRATVHAPGGPRKPVALVGFMGAGKSTVGERLAAALGWPFVDSDAVLAARFGPIAAQLAASEEEFRAREESLLRELAAAGPHVLATGGGAVTLPGARGLLATAFRTYWLDAPLTVIAARDTSGRPLWDDRVAERFAARRPLYEQVGQRIDGSAPVDLVVARILA